MLSDGAPFCVSVNFVLLHKEIIVKGKEFGVCRYSIIP